MISLGCPKNLVDSEYMLGILRSKNFHITDKVEDADLVIVNTCGFIQDAVEESIGIILDMVELKKKERIFKLIVVGCLVQRYGYKLMREIPEVDIWIGTGKINHILNILQEAKDKKRFFISKPIYMSDYNMPRLQSTPFYTAYLKISDGCSHRCSYCLIPKLRGPMRSVNPELLIDEAKRLVKNGVKEINIVAQDITMYGKDLNKNIGLEKLIKLLLNIKEIQWIRLLYLHPNGISDHLLKLMEDEERICPYIDIPIQHVNNHILKLMRRDYNKDLLWDIIEKIKTCKRRIYLRTTIMVGFPGETENIFEELYHFVKDVEFDHLGVFVFSPEQGTHAAKLMPKVKRKIAEKRKAELMSLQAKISKKKNKELIGKTIPVLIEGTYPETKLLLVGRTQGMAPDIDGQVIINKGYGILGEIMPVRITDAFTYDLVGEIL